MTIAGSVDVRDWPSYNLWSLLQSRSLLAGSRDDRRRLHVVVPIASLGDLRLVALTLRRTGRDRVRYHLRLVAGLAWCGPFLKLAATLGFDLRTARSAFGLGELAGIDMGAGDLLCILRPGEAISARELLAAASGDHAAGLLLTDGDDVNPRGDRSYPRMRGGWDPERDVDAEPVGAAVVHGETVAALVGGGAVAALAGREAPLTARALVAEVARRVGEGGIRHLPFVLHHRAIDATGPLASSASGESGAPEAARPSAGNGPAVSIVILSKDQDSLLVDCVSSLPAGPGVEIVVVDNGSTRPEALATLARLSAERGVTVVRDEGPFNWSRLNDLGIRHARGDVVILLNDDTYGPNPRWLDAITAQATRPEVGIVGIELLYPDGEVQHAGIVFSEGDAWHVWRHAEGRSEGYLGALSSVRSASAVTGACMAFRRSVYDEIGGLDMGFAVTWGDVDLCLRARRAGYRVVWTPHASMVHIEQASRGSDTVSAESRDRYAAERERFRAVWGEEGLTERFHSPHLLPGIPTARLRFDRREDGRRSRPELDSAAGRHVRTEGSERASLIRAL